jgi:putative ABC transport system permease protein
MQNFIQDLRFSLRMLFKYRGFTALAVFVLALGIGANSAIFSVVNGVLLRPLDYKNPERLVVLWEKMRQTDQLELAADDFVDYQNRNQVFEKFAASQRQGFNLTGGDEALRVEGGAVTADLFPLLGVAPALGRTFSPEEDRAGASHVVVLSYGLWQRRFGGDRNILNQPITLNGESYTVIGVMPASFQFPPPMAQGGTANDFRNELWVPRILETETYRNSHSLFAIGRLKDGVSFAQAKADLEAIAMERQQSASQSHSNISVNVLEFHDQVIRKVKPALMILLGAVALVLLIACANVASLLLIKATGRQKEMAIRAALGAGRLRIIRQLLTESLMLALVGGILGLLLAYWGNDFLLSLAAGNLPRANDVTVDARVLGFTLLLSLSTGIIFGLLPAFKASRVNLNESLKEGSRNSTASTSRTQRALVIAEVALSLILLIGAGLLMKSFYQLQQIDPGFKTSNLLVMESSLPESKYAEPQQQVAFFQQALEKLDALPGVQSAAIVNNPPLSSRRGVDAFYLEGTSEASKLADTPLADYRSISPDYFQAMQIPLLEGRPFAETDNTNAPPVAIVNRAVVRRYFNNESPLGRRIKFKDDWRTIVGVVGDVRQSGLDAEASTHLYVPFYQIPQGRMGIVVRTGIEPSNLVAAIREQFHQLDKELPVYNMQPMEQVMSAAVSQRRLNMLLLGFFAAIALLLSMIGIYGVISYSVSQRTREIGIRLTMGAQPKDVLRMVFKQGFLLALIGIVIGGIGAFALTRYLASLLYEVSVYDFSTFAIVSVLAIGVSLLACYLPARRATKVDPMVALRYE